MTSTELISAEVQKLIQTVSRSLGDTKRFAVSEAWRILQGATSSIVQIVESIGNDLAGPEKKALSLNLLSQFYDTVFTYVDLPVVPNFLEPIIHKQVKAFLMLLLGSTIDSLVVVFRHTGVFKPKQVEVL